MVDGALLVVLSVRMNTRALVLVLATPLAHTMLNLVSHAYS